MSLLVPDTQISESYSAIAELIRREGEKKIVGGYSRIVFTNGCFDLFHPGHIQTIHHAREIAGAFGAVIVGINDDDSCRRLKGDARPILDQNARALILVSMRDVDHVVTFSEDTPLKLIEALQPDFIVKGGDYDALNVIGKNISSVSIAQFDNAWSTSKIIERIKNS